MNRYGLIAREHWARHAPTRYATLEDPEAFFTQLGETAAAQIEAIATELERTLPADLPDQERVGQLRAIQKQAEEVVLAELVYSVEPEPASRAQELDDMLGQLPDEKIILDQLQWIQDQAEYQAEVEGHSRVALTEEQEELADRLHKLLPLVHLDRSPYEMDEAEVVNRIRALREVTGSSS